MRRSRRRRIPGILEGRVTIVMPLEKKWYGLTEFACVDPDGYVITFAEREATSSFIGHPAFDKTQVSNAGRPIDEWLSAPRRVALADDSSGSFGL